MVKRTILTALLVAAAAMASTAAATAATTSTTEQFSAGQGTSADRNVRRTPDVVAAALEMSPGCSATTLPIVCDITEPIVTEHRTTYPFSFLPGDHVVITAGGCVQTGGKGTTWKRYVDPAADVDLYHGLVTVPTATGELERLVNIVGRPLVIGGRGPVSLVLGYEDDDYSDNGYWGHDNGTGNQCANTGNASVHIVIS